MWFQQNIDKLARPLASGQLSKVGLGEKCIGYRGLVH